MPQPLSRSARDVLVEHLERALCDPSFLREHLRCVDSFAEGADWDGDLLQQLLSDPARLELLTDDELQRLHGDAAALLTLGGEITCEWWPAWNPPLAAVGRDWLKRAGPLPDWEDIFAPRSAEPPVTASKMEPAAAFGEVLDEPFNPTQRALVFDWTWTRPRGSLVALPLELPADARRLVNFHLQARASRQGTAGEWVLSVSGDPPTTPGAELTVELSGWARPMADRTAPVDLRPGATEITLTGFGDPTNLFINWNHETATVVVRCAGLQSWEVTEEVPGPRLNASFYAAWQKDRVDGLACCVPRLIAILARSQPTPNEERVNEAIVLALRDVCRRRHVYRDVASHAAFSALVVEFARRHYLQFFRGLKPDELLDEEQLPSREPLPDTSLFVNEIVSVLNECVKTLPREDQAVVQLRIYETLSHRAIAQRLNSSEEAVRVRYKRALDRLLRLLRERGYGAEDLVHFS